MRKIIFLALLTGGLAACSNPTETRVASACEVAFVDPPGERTTYDSIETLCSCFAKNTRDNEGSNYLARIEAALAALGERRAADGTAWPEAYVALEDEYKAAGNDTALEGLGDILARMSSVQDDLKADGTCNEFH
nr:hypothetical protein [uncultured Hyphomonas sp.]